MRARDKVMDKRPLHEALARINAAPEGVAVPISEEEAGMLHAFRTLRRRSGELSDREQALLNRVDDVLREWRPPAAVEDGAHRRHQHLLRTAIDKAQQANWASLHADEVELMRSTHIMLSNVSAPNKANQRLLALLDDLLRRLDVYEESLKRTPESCVNTVVSRGFGDACAVLIPEGPPTPRPDANTLEATAFFQRVTPGSVGFVGGCPVSLTVRTFEVNGPVRIEGDIPSDVLLRVKDGALTVNGFVAGHVVADGDIVVRGNVQGGWVIATRGSVSLNRALLGSRIIAEGGAVWCGGVEAAACVFGWNGVAIQESVLSSFVGGRCVWVGEKIVGTTIEACGPVLVDAIEGANLGASTVCLVREISSDVYGRHVSDEVRAMRRAIAQHERVIEQGARLMRYVRSLSQNCYRTAIFYLVGGVDAATVAPEFLELQALAVQLEELLSSAERIAHYYETVFSGAEARDADELELFTSEMLKAVAYIATPTESVLPSGTSSLHGTAANHAQDLARSLRFMQRNVDNSKGSAFFREAFQRTVRELHEHHDKTHQKVEALIATFEVHPDLLERVRDDRDSLDKLLAELVQRARFVADSDEAVRAQSPLIRVLRATAERNRKSIQHLQDEVDVARDAVENVRAKLSEDSAVVFAEDRPGAIYLEATAMDAGTIVTTAPNLRQGVDGTMREVIVLQQPVRESTRFVLEGALLRRMGSRLEAAGA